MDQFELEINRQKEIVKALMPNLDLPEEKLREVAQRYCAAIEPNFVYWLSATNLSVNSIEAKYACSENLLIEIKDDHRKMLREFMRQIHCTPSNEHYTCISKEVEGINLTISKLNSSTNLALMAYLENTSEIFIPVIEQIAIKLGAKDLMYTKVHGIADIRHSQQFNWALKYESTSSNYELAFILGQNLIRKIFTF